MKRVLLPLAVLILIQSPLCGQTAEEKKATIAYLRGLQTGDGGFLSAAPNPLSGRRDVPSLRATTGALRALKYFGGEPRDKKACIKFVEGCFDKKNGGFVDHQPTRKPDVISTAIGLMALVELKMPLEKYLEASVRFLGENAETFEEIRLAAAGLEAVAKKPKQADAWLKEVAKLRNKDGSYGKGDGAARDTGSAVVTVLRLGAKVEERDQVLKIIRSGQRADGGFGKADAKTSDLETCYRVVRALVMLKEKPADPAKCRAFVAKCRNADGGYGVEPSQKSSAAGTYFAAILLHWLAEK
jgi:prenyltransferase beta subunit